MKRLTEENISVGNTAVDTYTYEYDDYGNRSKMTATGSEEFTTVYNYKDENSNYTTLLQKEVKTVEVAESEDSFTGLVSNPTERLNNLNSTSNVKETVYTYDANGSQLTKTTDEKTETNTYNAVNQLVGFTDGETIASYTYNADGLRASKTVDGETVKHVWDGAKQIIADVKNGAFYQADCYIRGTNLVAKYSYVNGAKSEYTYYTQNAHGDVVNLTDTDGIVIKTYKYDAFGVEKNIDDADSNAFRYCGEYYDKETATIYLRARHYNPSNGRFIQRDSFSGKIEDPLSLNLYTYCGNNPILYWDPSGHDAVAAAEYIINNSRPSTRVNSAWDAKLLTDWDNEFNKILNVPVQINSPGDAALYQKATSPPSFKVNSMSDAKIFENQMNFYEVIKNVQDRNLVAAVKAANSIKPFIDPQIPPDHPLYVPPKKGGKNKVKDPNGPGRGWPAKDGGVWVPDNNMHGGSGWTVQYPNGSHWHAYPGGATRELEVSVYNDDDNDKSRYNLHDDLIFGNDDDLYSPNYYGIPFQFGYSEVLLW